ncbi:HIT family protein [Spirillospora sp. CA-294931]|uniref:HIT family protein n=1 Tax=Spirillospora sp. CA-294931 TaxID=3240042 RepID=UPI003D8BCC66
MTCVSCRTDAALATAPPREHIASDTHWRAAHAFGTDLLGWLVLVPRRHVTAVAALTDAEAATLGAWQVRLSRALHAVTGCEKTYIAQFAEAEGFAHVHFHIVARMPDQAPELKGPRVFALLGAEPGVSAGRRDEFALELRRRLV